jgi:hypothetical protein
MKTVENTLTGLPSFEPEWPTKAERKREPEAAGAIWGYERLNQNVQNALWEDAWRGIREYDSPLAG